MITIVGTGHVFDLKSRLTAEIAKRSPTIVALELDPGRYRALLAPPESEKDAPLAYRAVASIQERIAASYGVRAGDEMRAASELARDLRVPVALIDLDARVLFDRLKREMPWREKFRLLGATVGGLLAPMRGIESEVEALASDYSAAFAEMGVKFPTLKRVLLDERNAHMARAVVSLHRDHPRVVAVVGDGHVDGMLAILRDEGVPVETVRLRELRETGPRAAGTATAGFSYEWKEEGADR